jgi:hypothetical protein
MIGLGFDRVAIKSQLSSMIEELRIENAE